MADGHPHDHAWTTVDTWMGDHGIYRRQECAAAECPCWVVERTSEQLTLTGRSSVSSPDIMLPPGWAEVSLGSAWLYMGPTPDGSGSLNGESVPDRRVRFVYLSREMGGARHYLVYRITPAAQARLEIQSATSDSTLETLQALIAKDHRRERTSSQ